MSVIPRTAPGTPTWEIAELFPLQGMWGEHDYLPLRPTHAVEFTDGVLEILPMPTFAHQAIVEFLFLVLRQFVMARGLGRVMFAPLRVQLRPGKYREPDLVFMRAEHRARMGNAFWLGADLVLEVVSDDSASRERDLVQKPLDYAEGGVPEYWLVDPVLGRITVLVLEGSAYREHGVFTPGQHATSATLPGLMVDVAAVFEAGRLAE